MNKNLLKNYGALMAKYRELAIFSSAQRVLGWDMHTKMPPRGIKLRAEQLALLSGIEHRMSTDPEIGKLLGKIEGDSGYPDLNPLQQRNIHLVRKNYDEQIALPENLVTEMQRQSSIANDIWRKAKAAKNWEMFRPELEKNVELAKKAAAILMQVKKTTTPYDALLDIFEPGMTADHITVLFNQLQTGIVSLLDRIKRAPEQPDTGFLSRIFPADLQSKIATALAESVNYDVSSKNAGGRIDETEHPFTTGYYDDVRITTHYHEDRFAYSVFAVLHEAGHALYEQDINPEWIYQPAGSGCSTGIHESQSRVVENIIGRSPEFWIHFFPRLKEIAGDRLADVDLDQFVFAVNEVKPSKIRIESDEVTYSLHIIIRFNIERDLFAGKITVKDLPEIWNRAYRDYLGITIENDSEGVMQDTHWSSGAFGYFPGYALGNIYDGLLLNQMNQDVPGWPQELAKGNFLPVKEWLIKNIHSQGNLYDPPALIRRITGQRLTVEPYLKYLNAKYSELYGL